MLALCVALLLAAACTDEAPPATPEPTVVAPTTSTSETGSAPPSTPGSEAATPPSTEGAGALPIGDATRARVDVELVAEGFDAPLQVLPSPWGGLLVVEQPGRIQLLRDGERTTYLDLTSRVTTGGERGLLGVAFHPDAPDDPRLYVHYSGLRGRTTLASLTASADGADPGSEQVLLTVEQPASNHNGGQLLFGPDGMLWLGLGDGGASGDRFGNGQRPDTLLGTILRLDVQPDGSYTVPPDNPWAAGGEGAPEVWAYGLRNPWRFDIGGGRLYVADVGQNAIEEVDSVPVGAAGVNYGWPILEGTACFAEDPCDPTDTVLPVTEYTHDDTGGCSIIGGRVYAGTAIPDLAGWFLYTDLCAGFLRAVHVDEAGRVREADVTPASGTVGGILGFGPDADGELHLAVQDGRILKLVPAG